MAVRHVRIGLGQFKAVVTKGLLHILSETEMLSVAGAGLDMETLERLAKQKLLQVILLDETDIVAQGALERLRAVDPQVGLIVLSNTSTLTYSTRLVAAGANACLSKDLSKRELLSTIWLAADGKYVLKSVTHDTAAKMREVRPLTPREQEVFDLACLGYSNARIARDLYLDIETVRTHLAHIYRKLGIKSRRELHGIHLHLPDRASRR